MGSDGRIRLHIDGVGDVRFRLRQDVTVDGETYGLGSQCGV
jgi:hypothetical protein